MSLEINEKWGFGMAPPKPATQARRVAAAAAVLKNLQTRDHDAPGLLENLSEMKGLFNRVVRQDQWDWFTVASQLGFPSAPLAGAIAGNLYELRWALRGNDIERERAARDRLMRSQAQKCIAVFLGHLKIAEEPGAGWVYVLSTREMRDVLKIGMTTRTVQERVTEINSATGIAIPFGVRKCWRVSDPVAAEKAAHACMTAYRVRRDREFFRVDYRIAVRVISEAFDASDLELRTLRRLAALNK